MSLDAHLGWWLVLRSCSEGEKNLHFGLWLALSSCACKAKGRKEKRKWGKIFNTYDIKIMVIHTTNNKEKYT